MRRVIAICVMAVMLSSCAQKAEVENLADGSCSSAQAQLVDQHISGQINALAAKNWQSAFSYASESFQENIGLDQFTQIISSQYSMLIENQGYKFETCDFADDKVTQEVRVTSGGQDYLLTHRVSINGSKLGIEGAVVGMVDTPVTV
jgi:hypothetical protein